MDLGGSAISGDGTRVYQPGRLPGALPAHLWRRRIAAVYSSRLFAPKAHKSVCPFPVCLLCAGISDQLFSGAAMGNQMVGLQRTFPEYQWEDLSAGGSGFRTGRNGACVPVFAFL